MAKLEINYDQREDQNGQPWVHAEIEDFDGNLLGSVTAPIVEGATFDQRGAVIRQVVEEALPKLGE